MTFYRNSLTHIFWEESLVILALTSFGHDKIITKSVSVDQLFEATKFLSGLLIKEFVLRYSLQDRKRFEDVLALMESKNIFRTEDGFVMMGA